MAHLLSLFPPQEILGTRDANPKSLSLQEIIIVGNCEKQVSFNN